MREEVCEATQERGWGEGGGLWCFLRGARLSGVTLRGGGCRGSRDVQSHLRRLAVGGSCTPPRGIEGPGDRRAGRSKGWGASC